MVFVEYNFFLKNLYTYSAAAPLKSSWSLIPPVMEDAHVKESIVFIISLMIDWLIDYTFFFF